MSKSANSVMSKKTSILCRCLSTYNLSASVTKKLEISIDAIFYENKLEIIEIIMIDNIDIC